MECPINLDKIHCQNCYFMGKDGKCHYEETDKSNWGRSDCPICGRSFPHHKDYKPVTCGKFACLQEANRRGLFPQKIFRVIKEVTRESGFVTILPMLLGMALLAVGFLVYCLFTQ